MNTLQFYLDETARKYERKDWSDLRDNTHPIDKDRCFREAAELYAEEECKEQRRLCASVADKSPHEQNQILTCPLAVNTDKDGK